MNLQDAEKADCGALLEALAEIDEELHERRWSGKVRQAFQARQWHPSLSAHELHVHGCMDDLGSAVATLCLGSPQHANLSHASCMSAACPSSVE